MSDLVEWLRGCYDRAEQKARAATPGPWRWVDPGDRTKQALVAGDYPSQMVVPSATGDVYPSVADAAHIAGHGPAWRLDDLARKRAIFAEHETDKRWPLDRSRLGCRTCRLRGDVAVDDEWPCITVRLLAAEFADQPGYDAQRWAP